MKYPGTAGKNASQPTVRQSAVDYTVTVDDVLREEFFPTDGRMHIGNRPDFGLDVDVFSGPPQPQTWPIP